MRLLAFLKSTFLNAGSGGRGGGGGGDKGRYGCAASAKPRPGKKVPKNLITGQVFMNFRVPKLGFFSK